MSWRKAGRVGCLVGIVMATVAPTALGATAHRKHAQPRIIGGVKAQPGSWKFMAYVSVQTSRTEAACSGTLVSSNVVLTAAHCVTVTESSKKLLPRGDFYVTTGSLDWATLTAHVTKVSKVVINPAYKPQQHTSDLALLVLSHAVQSPSVTLASPSDSSLDQAGTPAEIAGWGKLKGSQKAFTQALHWAPTVVQSSRYCLNHAPLLFSASLNLCAQNKPTNNTATCQGDSGGPMVAMDSSNQPIEIGITSYGGQGCPTSQPSFFTKVSAFYSWIHSWITAEAP